MKKNGRFLSTIAVSLFLGGCLTTANLVKHPYEGNSTSSYAPESENRPNGIGVVSYLNEGVASIREARRNDAYKKAYQSCNGQYQIIEERSTYTDPVYITTKPSNVNNSYTAWGGSSEYRYIYFSCGSSALARAQDSLSEGKKTVSTFSALESQIEGDFEGFDGETIIKLTNGQIWQQSEYHYHYHYSFMPRVLIFRADSGYKIKVDGIEKPIGVTRIR